MLGKAVFYFWFYILQSRACWHDHYIRRQLNERPEGAPSQLHIFDELQIHHRDAGDSFSSSRPAVTVINPLIRPICIGKVRRARMTIEKEGFRKIVLKDLILNLRDITVGMSSPFHIGDMNVHLGRKLTLIARTT